MRSIQYGPRMQCQANFKVEIETKLDCNDNIAIYILTFQFLFPIDTPNIDWVTASLA